MPGCSVWSGSRGVRQDTVSRSERTRLPVENCPFVSSAKGCSPPNMAWTMSLSN